MVYELGNLLLVSQKNVKPSTQSIHCILNKRKKSQKITTQIEPKHCEISIKDTQNESRFLNMPENGIFLVYMNFQSKIGYI